MSNSYKLDFLWYLQVGVRSSPICLHLFMGCGQSEHLVQQKGFRQLLMLIRTCTQVVYSLTSLLFPSCGTPVSVTYFLFWTAAWFLFLTTSRWFAVRLDGICAIFVTVTTFGCLLLRDRKEGFSLFWNNYSALPFVILSSIKFPQDGARVPSSGDDAVS